MRNLILMPFLGALALALGGCLSADNTGTAGTSDTVKQVQAEAVKICGYLPTVATVGAIVTTFTGGAGYLDVATSVAGAICDAVTRKGAARGHHATVRGVQVKGRFVR